MVDISNNLVDIWGVFWWSIFDKTPLAALYKIILKVEICWQLLVNGSLWSSPPIKLGSILCWHLLSFLVLSLSDKQVFLMLSNLSNKAGVKYLIKDNVGNLFTRMIGEGKATIR